MKSGSKDQIDAMDFDLFRETTQPASKAADVAKPKARLCEPWVTMVNTCRSRGAALSPFLGLR